MIRKTADRQRNHALENLGAVDRRTFVHGLGFGALAALLPASLGTFAELSAEAAAGPRLFPVPTNINHLSCGVKDYAKSRDFYMGLFDMKLVWDNGSMCALEFGNPAAPNGLYIRGLTKPTDKSEVGHVAYGIPNFMKYKAAIKKEMEKYHLTEIRPDGEVGWICNDPAGYMLNIIVEKDKAMYPGAAAFCDVADSDKCRQGYGEGVKNLNVGPKPGTAAFKPLYFSHVVLNVPESQLATEFEFYRDMMGMKVIYRKTTGDPKTFLRFGQNTLYLQKTEKPDEKAYCTHFAFVVENFNFDKVEAELKRRGLDPKPDSKLAWTITDPDGFRVEIAGPGLPEHIAKDCNGVNTSCPGGLRG
jgi:catechol 2,3-dioxygenase-like lactoylglutathione lyase family enzyme